MNDAATANNRLRFLGFARNDTEACSESHIGALLKKHRRPANGVDLKMGRTCQIANSLGDDHEILLTDREDVSTRFPFVRSDLNHTAAHE